MELSPEGKRLVERALTKRAWTLEKLAEKSSLGIATVKNFNSGKSVSRITFVNLCEKLEIDWEIASGQANTDSDSSRNRPSTPASSNEALFEQVRERCRQKILNQHSRMRLLSGEEIGVDQLYVDVWLLNRSPRTFRVSQNKLLQTFDLRNDRLGLGDRIHRIEGFEVANENHKLVILGKPGSGKTTFLKHLAVDWCKGEFQPNLMAVLIEFRRIRDEQWYLLGEIEKELGLDEGDRIRDIKEQIKHLQRSISTSIEEKKKKEEQIEKLQQKFDTLPLQVLLTQGKLLILMDGLDEVPTNELRGIVQEQLHTIAEEYNRNRFVLTCRTQIMTFIPNGFTSVEVADFTPKQVQRFAEKWFMTSGKSRMAATQHWETIKNAVDNSPPLKELTVTPVVLSLMCLVCHDEGEMPLEKTLLYKKGINLLLNRWNEEKQIAGWEVGNETYRKLSVERKEELLIEIAAHKFDNPKNFVLFEQDEIADQIIQFLNLANCKEGVAVLKAIEAQHGLLIERADELWSFSHLTFQEYFTFQWLIKLSTNQLAKKLANQQWQEVVRQLVKSQQPADRLLRLIKQAIDQSIARQLEINQFLTWVLQKSGSTQLPYKPAAIRAIDFVIARSYDLDLDRALERAHDRDLDRLLAHDLARALNRALDFTLALTLDRESISKLTTQPEQLKVFLPKDPSEFWQWWQTNGIQWVEQLRQVMISHRNTGHNWQFNDQQKQQLQRYYDANQFLVNLMQIKGAVSEDVRAEIEDSLLLPWNELQRRHPETYESS